MQASFFYAVFLRKERKRTKGGIKAPPKYKDGGKL